jgi:hypothetical protein
MTKPRQSLLASARRSVTLVGEMGSPSGVHEPTELAGEGLSMERERTDSARADRQWFIVGRWQEYAGEARANLLRIAAIGAFYVIELVNYHGLDLGPLQMPSMVDQQFHQVVTALAIAWTMVALGTQLCLKVQVFPSGLKYVTTGCDVVLLTTILTVADGPRSPLVVGYFLIIVLSTLRFQLRLVWCATLGSLAGYLFLNGYARWFAAADRQLSVPRYQQLIILLALALTGIILGQVIRRVRALAEEFAQRLGDGSGKNV